MRRSKPTVTSAALTCPLPLLDALCQTLTLRRRRGLWIVTGLTLRPCRGAGEQ